MTLRARLAIGLIAIAIVLLVPLGIALRSLERLHATTAGLRSGEFAASLLLGRMHGAIDDLRRADDALLFVHDSTSREHMDKTISQLEAMSDTLLGYHLDTPAGSMRSALSQIASAVPAEYEHAIAGEGALADSVSSRDVRPAITSVERQLGAAEGALRVRTQRRVSDAADETSTAQSLSAVSLVLALLLALLIAVWLTQSISRPVRELQEGMQIVAEGGFTYRLPTSTARPDEFGRLAASFAQMSRQLMELDKLKAEFVSVASHELKTPINVILGYVQLLEEGMYGDLTPKQREVIATLAAQGNSLSRLVRQLLDIGRFQAAGGKIEPRPVHLATFLGDLERAFHVLAHQREVAFQLTCDDGTPEQVVWDEDRMNEVLGNLLSNAFKFTGPGGQVQLCVSGHGDNVRMEIHDTGAGIPREQLQHIFKKFYQADNQDAASAKGTGLGLAIAKEIVVAHHGTIDVTSRPGAGTTFIIDLPAHVTSARRSAPHAAISAHS